MNLQVKETEAESRKRTLTAITGAKGKPHGKNRQSRSLEIDMEVAP
jgi:hypothetical protein